MKILLWKKATDISLLHTVLAFGVCFRIKFLSGRSSKDGPSQVGFNGVSSTTYFLTFVSPIALYTITSLYKPPKLSFLLSFFHDWTIAIPSFPYALSTF